MEGWVVVATRRRFTDEYKRQAVEFVLDSDRPVAEVARNIGCHEMTLGKWVKKERESRAAKDPGEPLDASERAELVRLREQTKTDRAKISEPGDAGRVRKKSSDLVREPEAVRCAAIADWAEEGEYPVTFMCKQLGVSRSG
ncbi:MAG: hypothetical protein CSA58_06835 [Micrococcales bacterium]|nr:MAG: hypothetical protein CSA58_06835 [Micrococcales bacterium]